MQTFEIEPQAVVHDLHPGYLSTQWAKQWAAEHGLPLLAVQHHHAHIAGCMAEHGLQGQAIGLALDGTGYGTDGRIWGGEVLLCGPQGMERFAHLEYVPMPGSDAAVREPWRIAFAALRTAGFDQKSAAALVGVQEKEARVLNRMMERGVNAPLTSSLGRLFDAVAAVVLQRHVVDYEAQAAIELEGVAIDEPLDLDCCGYELEFVANNLLASYADGDKLGLVSGHDFSRAENGKEKKGASAPAVLHTARLWQTLIEELRQGVSKPKISARFHAGVAAGFIQAAVQAREATGIAQVALSGGCLHNRRLSYLLRSGLEKEGFAVYLHRQVSPGDGGLSYGQIAVALTKHQEEH